MNVISSKEPPPPPPSQRETPPPYPSFGETARVWLKIGCLSFGGPAGQIALMHKELVDERRWISEERFLHALNYCMLLPGPEAQQLATYIGWLLHGVRGGLTAGLLFILPGLAVILALSATYAVFQGEPVLEGLFFGLKAAVLAIVVEAVIRLGRRALGNGALMAIAVLGFLAMFALKAPFPLVIAAAGIVGYLGARYRPELFRRKQHSDGTANRRVTLALPEPRAPAGLGAALRTIAVWGGIWASPVLLAMLTLGRDSILMPIAGLFSQMAVVTFGGAYAVLAYVAQEAVTDYGWLRPGEMLDGLAMAETTPGPLILVLTYVGFLAAFRAPDGLDPLFSGLLGGLMAAWVTFAPCFLWIFLGAPYIERLRSNQALAGALAAVTAAVVGVIMNLALWFGLHVLFREVGTLEAGFLKLSYPIWTSLDQKALLLALIATVLLIRFRLGAPIVLAGSAVAGLAMTMALW
jgi:chromate transporter